jgi:hypothetical protein
MAPLPAVLDLLLGNVSSEQGIKGLDKSVPMEKRISKCKAIVTQVSIARVHNMPGVCGPGGGCYRSIACVVVLCVR